MQQPPRSMTTHTLVSFINYAGFICVLLFFSAAFVTSAQEDQILTNCPAKGENYTSGSQYQTNLNTLLRSLATNAVRNIDSYYNASVGSAPGNRIYGYAQCMSGATASACSACLSKAISDLPSLCPNKRVATLRYYSCILRYSDENFFSVSDRSLIVYMLSPGEVNEPAVFNERLDTLMKNLTNAAASNSSKMAWGSTRYNESSGNLYGMVQCTRDLPVNECSSCLAGVLSVLPSCCQSKPGGSVYLPSCNIRFETSSTDPFSPVQTQPPPPSPPPPSPPPPPRSSPRPPPLPQSSIAYLPTPSAVLFLTFILYF